MVEAWHTVRVPSILLLEDWRSKKKKKKKKNLSERYWIQQDTSEPRIEMLISGPILNPVPRIFASTPVTPIRAPVSTPSPSFTPTGPARALALAISADAIAPAPRTEAYAPALAFGPLASASRTLTWADALPTPAPAKASTFGMRSPGLSSSLETCAPVEIRGPNH